MRRLIRVSAATAVSSLSTSGLLLAAPPAPPRVFVEMQGAYINTFDGDPADAGVDNGDGTFTKTVTIGNNSRIGNAGVVKDFGNGSVTITNLTIAGKVLDFK